MYLQIKILFKQIMRRECSRGVILIKDKLFSIKEAGLGDFPRWASSEPGGGAISF